MPTRAGIDSDNDLTGRGTPRTPTRTRRIFVYGNVYRFAVYVYVSGPS
ncbi:MAG: hypothetical protein ACOX52_16010 [Verrucomicrobiota bacterium]